MSAEIRVHGVRTIQRQLQGLGRKGLSVLNASARASMTPVLQRARALAPVRSGNLQASLGISRRTRSAAGTVEVSVGVRKDYTVRLGGERVRVRGRDGGPAGGRHPLVYAAFVETGAHPSGRGRTIRPRRFLAGAWQQQAAAIPTTLAAELRRRLNLTR